MTTADLTAVRRARRAHRLRRIAIVAAAAAAVIGLAAAAWFSPVLALKDVRVSRSQLVDADAVRSSVLRAYEGTPLPQIRTGTLADRLRSEFPLARDFAVRWAGPNALRVTITDREPAFAARRGGSWEVYDREAVKLGTREAAPEDVPRFIGQPTPENFAAAGRLLSELGDRAGTVTAVAVHDPQLTAAIVEPERKYRVTVVFGTPEDLERKVRYARAIMADRPASIDVSTPTVATAKKRPPEWTVE